MTSDTKAEIIIVSVAALALFWLWGRNKAAGAGSGLNISFPFTNNPVPGTANPAFTIPSPLPGDIFQYTGNVVPNPPALTFGQVTGTGSCSCGDNLTQSTFGSQADLAAWLMSQPGYSSEPIGSNWY